MPQLFVSPGAIHTEMQLPCGCFAVGPALRVLSSYSEILQLLVTPELLHCGIVRGFFFFFGGLGLESVVLNPGSR